MLLSQAQHRQLGQLAHRKVLHSS